MDTENSSTSVRSVAFIKKASLYQKHITLSAVFLIITSTFLIFNATILMKFYHLTKLGFWSTYFEMVPYFMIVLGLFTFISGLYGAFVAPLGKKVALIVYAILMAITFLAQLGSIFTALEVRSDIENNKGDAGIQKEFPLVSCLFFLRSVVFQENCLLTIFFKIYPINLITGSIIPINV